MKKLISTLAVGAFLTVGLTGCGPSQEELMEDALWNCAEWLESEYLARIGVPDQGALSIIMQTCLDQSEEDAESFLERWSD